MQSGLDFRDLSIRVFVIAVTSIILIFVTRDNKFDLHFKLRVSQQIHKDLLLIDVPTSVNTDSVINKLNTLNPKTVFISHYLYEKSESNLSIYSINEIDSKFLDFNLQPDTDGFIRRVKLNNQKKINLLENANKNNHENINFRGNKDSFSRINYLDIDSNYTGLDNKIVIISSLDVTDNYTTPIGLMQESELIATVIDNYMASRFIPKKNFIFAFTILALLLGLTVLFLIYLPSTLALISTIAITILYISLSLWLFDHFYIWTPILTPIIQMFLSFLLISNYKFVLNEKTRWSLEKEALYSNQLEEMKTNFLSLFSHDLKTPLAKIIGISDTLSSKVSDPEIKSEIEKINLASKDLEKYIKRILKMSQVQSKNISLNKAPEDINILIEKSLELNRFAANEKEISFEQNLPPLFMIEMDSPLIQEVINNFIENAIRYSPEKSRVWVMSEEVNNYIKVTVKDEGKGIPKEAQDNIWEKYYRFDKDQSGYGLGLFLSRYVIHLHGGQVFLNSKENSGSEFGFIIPFGEEST